MVQPSLTDYVTQSASAIPNTLKSTMAWTQLVKDSAWNSAKNTYNWASGLFIYIKINPIYICIRKVL